MSALDPPPPGFQSTNELALKSQERERPTIEAYAALLQRIAGDSGCELFSDMLAAPKTLIRGLRSFASHQDFVNDKG